jgi:hypothetical protein
LQETGLRLPVRRQQRIDFAAHGLIGGTNLIQISVPLLRIHLQHGFQDVLDFPPSVPQS